MTEIKDFMMENQFKILSVAGFVLFMLVIINMRGINLNEPNPETKLVQEVTIETFSAMPDPSCPGMFSRNFSKFS